MRLTKVHLIECNNKLQRELSESIRAHTKALDELSHAKRELNWVRQQFETLMRTIADYGWPRKIEARADFNADTVMAVTGVEKKR